MLLLIGVALLLEARAVAHARAIGALAASSAGELTGINPEPLEEVPMGLVIHLVG